MSASNLRIHSVGGYNFASVSLDGAKYIIGGVCEEYKKEYINEAKDAKAIILLTSKPIFCGGIKEIVSENPDTEIYASAAGLRNIKEIINLQINEKLIKDAMTVSDISFFVTPNLHWVDSVSVKVRSTLFSGELFSGIDKRAYYMENLAVNEQFAKSALERFKKENIEKICPAYGDIYENPSDAYSELESFFDSRGNSRTKAVVVYSSVFGYTKSLAEHTAKVFAGFCDTVLVDACDYQKASDEIKSADILAVGVNTINRNAPQSVWDIITRIDLVKKRGMPYFVFGSFGWAGDGIKLIDKTLSAMGLNRVIKPVEVLFAPKDEDFIKIEKAVEEIVGFYNSQSGE